MPRFYIDPTDNKKLRILCDENDSPLNFVLLKPMPEELTQRLQQLIDYLEKKQSYYDLETVELLIQYLSQSNIKLENIHGILYTPFD